MLSRLSSLLAAWQSLCFSWLGRVASVKMTLLPKLLYHFRVLPVLIPSYFFRAIQCRVYKYIWGPTRPRVLQTVLLRSRLAGGLGVPNFQYFYYTDQLAQLTLYHANVEMPLWVGLEAVDIHPLTVSNLLWMYGVLST